jgi:cell division cycle 2-like protein
MLSDAGFDLLNRMLTYDPSRRITAREALEHRWFNESPFPVDPDMMPTWPSRSEGRPRARNQESEEASEALRNVPHGVSGN